MKKILLCFSALVLLNIAHAQTWCPPGATWHFTRNNGMQPGTDGFAKLVYTGDSSINNISCKIIRGAYTGKTYFNSPVIFDPDYVTYYTYENNKVIFVHNGVTFDTIVDFNAHIGDQWLRPNRSGNTGCNSRRALTVTDTGHVVINSVNLKKVVTTYTSSYTAGSNTYTVNNTNTFIERAFIHAGGMFNDLFPLYCEQNDVVAEGYFMKFKCYEDNSFSLYNSDISTACESITGIRSLAGNLTGLSVYPNPAGDQLSIDLPAGRNFSFRISDLMGKTMPAESFETAGKTWLGTGQLDKGVYFLQVFENGQLAGSQKIIKN